MCLNYFEIKIIIAKFSKGILKICSEYFIINISFARITDFLF